MFYLACILLKESFELVDKTGRISVRNLVRKCRLATFLVSLSLQQSLQLRAVVSWWISHMGSHDGLGGGVEVLVAKPVDLNLIPTTYLVEGEN